MTPLIIKSVTGLAMLGGSGLSSWGIFKFLKPKTLGEQLLHEGHSFYPLGDEMGIDGWKELAKKYRNESIKNGGINGVSIINEEPNDEEIKQLQGGCRELSNREMDGEDEGEIKRMLESWCVIQIPKPNIWESLIVKD